MMIQYSLETSVVAAIFKILMGIVTIGIIEMLLSFRKKKTADRFIFHSFYRSCRCHNFARALFVRRISLILKRSKKPESYWISVFY